MLEYKGVKYNITDEPNLNGKGRLFQYSINFEPLTKTNANSFQEAKRIVEKKIDNNDSNKNQHQKKSKKRKAINNENCKYKKW